MLQTSKTGDLHRDGGQMPEWTTAKDAKTDFYFVEADEPEHYAMLERNLLCTGVTRGKSLVVLVGQEKAVAIAVRGIRNRQRWSKLRGRLPGSITLPFIGQHLLVVHKIWKRPTPGYW